MNLAKLRSLDYLSSNKSRLSCFFVDFIWVPQNSLDPSVPLSRSESTWRQRHSALQRQLQRTERQLSVSASLWPKAEALSKAKDGSQTAANHPFFLLKASTQVVNGCDTDYESMNLPTRFLAIQPLEMQLVECEIFWSKLPESRWWGPKGWSGSSHGMLV